MKRRIIVTEEQMKKLSLNENGLIQQATDMEKRRIMDEYDLVDAQTIRDLLSMMDQKCRRDDIGNQTPEQLQETILEVYQTLSDLVHW